jgi:hypothetical protein
VLGKWLGILHGKFWIKLILSLILGDSLHDAGLVFLGFAPKSRVFVLMLKTAEQKAVSLTALDVETLQT